MPENFTVLEVRELDTIADKCERIHDENYKMLVEFVQQVKADCVIDKIYFDFFSIPDLIIRMKYSKKQYDLILKILLKVKKSYLEIKIEKELMEKMTLNMRKRNLGDD